ncbi:hypothetical protein NL30_36315 [Burkholderia contaminans]|nr:hypothetical protein NL30_36315 [Burkholderia contaminans]
MSLWTGISEFILSNQSAALVRCTVQRARNGQPAVENFDFVVGPKQQSRLVVWLEAPDTGSIQLIDVTPCSPHGQLDGLESSRVEVIFEERGPATLALIRNTWSVPVYVSVDLNHHDGVCRRVVLERSLFGPIYESDSGTPEFQWQAAELQRTSLYGLWPPAL